MKIENLIGKGKYTVRVLNQSYKAMRRITKGINHP